MRLMQPCKNRRNCCLVMALVLAHCCVLGCHSLRHAAKPSLFPHQVERGQIVLHSDFPLPQHERLVEELCAQRERLAARLSLPLTDEPIHVYLFADDHSYYDFLDLRFPGFPPRRAIFVETDAQLAVYAHWGEHTAEDLRHEVTHGYLHAALPYLPLWLDEGIAEYFEVAVGYGGLNSPHLNHLLNHIEFRPNLPRLELLTNAADMTQLDYAESWAWVHFLLDSDADKTNLLTNYLADLQQGATSSLSEHLPGRLNTLDVALVEHLQALR